jgi:hypothetical protein
LNFRRPSSESYHAGGGIDPGSMIIRAGDGGGSVKRGSESLMILIPHFSGRSRGRWPNGRTPTDGPTKPDSDSEVTVRWLGVHNRDSGLKST